MSQLVVVKCAVLNKQRSDYQRFKQKNRINESACIKEYLVFSYRVFQNSRI